jgi:hypothetical protein
MKTTGGRVDVRGRVWRSAQERRELIEAFEACGLGKAAYCRRRGIPLATFCNWLKRRTKTEPVFAEVQVVGRAPTLPLLRGAAPVEIELPSGVRVHVRDTERLAQLTAFIRELSPC